jgi:hypothetical protein
MTRNSGQAVVGTPTFPAIPKTDVLGRLAALHAAPIATLKQQWRELYGKEPPPFSRSYIQSRLAYRIQELAYGGLKPETRARLEALRRMPFCRPARGFGHISANMRRRC